MRLVAVLDVMKGKVVRGIGGGREFYRPIESRLTSSTDPLDIALAFRDNLNLHELYLADLDAISGAKPSFSLYRELCNHGFKLWVDAGLHDADGLDPLLEAGVQFPVAGLETLSGPEILSQLYNHCGERLVFSLDLKNGRPLTSSSKWPKEPWEIAECAIAQGVSRILVLDISRVGEGMGTGTEELCSKLTAYYPALEVSAGGGIRGLDDFRRMSACGVSAVLVASMLHDASPNIAEFSDPGNI